MRADNPELLDWASVSYLGERPPGMSEVEARIAFADCSGVLAFDCWLDQHEHTRAHPGNLVWGYGAAEEAQPYLCSDSTGVLVQAKERCRNGHFWVVVAPERHALFRYTAKHDSAAVDSILKAYRGFLVVDATTVLDHLYADSTIVEVGCWAH